MNRLSRCAVLLALAFLLPCAATAGEGPLVINFDTDTNGQPIPNYTDVATTYSSWGVTFENSDSSCGNSIYASSDCLDAEAPSPPNIVTTCSGGCTDIAENFHGLVRAVFATPADQVCIYYIPLDTDDEGVIRAYDASRQLIGEELSAVGTPGDLCISATGILSVEFSGHGDLYGQFDNLAVQFALVPVAPVTWSAIKTVHP